MSSVNKVILIGNVGKDPEIRSFSNGGEMASLSVATSEKWKDKHTGERKEKTEWHSVVVMRDSLVQVVKQYVSKGDKLYVEGKLQTRKWQDKSGVDRYSTEVVVDSLTMLGSKEQGRNTGITPPSQQQQDMSGFDDLDDEIPF